ncbi:MAG: AraC family transcriptional regulator ligand-binding domain-containing protein [Magnetospiraceae bacterium]
MEKAPAEATHQRGNVQERTFANTSAEDELARPVQWDRKLHLPTHIALMYDELVAAGSDPTAVLSAAGLTLTDIRSEKTRVSLGQVLAAYKAASQAALDPTFAFQSGARRRMPYFGMYGFAMMSAPDLRTMMHFAVEAQSLAANLVHVKVQQHGNQVAIIVDPFAHRDIDSDLYRFLVEEHFGMVHGAFRDMTGGDFKPSALHVTYAPRTSLSEIGRLLGVEPCFQHRANIFFFDASWLDARPQFGNLIAHGSVRKACKELLGELQQQEGVARLVGEALIASYGRIPDVEEIAEQMGMSARSLRRRLSAEKTSYREICANVLSQIAMRYLRDTSLAVEHIASVIGFDNAANFRRAFRRWTGMTPLEFRHSAGAHSI